MKMSPQDVAALFHEIATLIETGDSFEGSIEYRIPDDFDGDKLEVTGAHRYGNRDHGQGFMRVIGATPIADDDPVAILRDRGEI